MPVDATLSIQRTVAVKANAGNAVLTVTRAADLTGTSTVNYGTSNGTALSGVNYTTTSGSLTFDPDDETKTITVPILNDGVQDTNLLFSVTLSGPSAGTVIVDAVGCKPNLSETRVDQLVFVARLLLSSYCTV